jgi:hypothetical protein
VEVNSSGKRNSIYKRKWVQLVYMRVEIPYTKENNVVASGTVKEMIIFKNV